jgi:hypothetical protein
LCLGAPSFGFPCVSSRLQSGGRFAVAARIFTVSLCFHRNRDLRDTVAMTAAAHPANLARDAARIMPGPRLRAAMVVAIVADLIQLAVFPLVIEGAESPADDILDLCVGGLLSWLLGWHWEFAPSFLAKLVPGVDMVPLWTLAVANVYRKSKHAAVTGTAAPSRT